MPGQEIVVPRAQDEPGESDPRRSRWLVTRSDRPIVPGSIALLTALAFVLARWQTWAEGDITRFILVGRHFATPSQLPPGIAVAPTYGYDGQFFYRLALNPVNFSHIAYGIRVDQPYRYMRIGYPWLTWLVSFGQHVLVPVMLVVINIVAIGAMGYLGGMFARQGGRHALAGLVLPAYFGLLTSLSRDTAEPLAAACLLGGLLAIRARRPVLAGLLLAYGALTRESVMVAVAAVAIVDVIGVIRRRRSVRPGRDDLVWALPTAAFVAWQVVVKAAVGRFPPLVDANGNTGSPFITPLKAVEHNHPAGHTPASPPGVAASRARGTPDPGSHRGHAAQAGRIVTTGQHGRHQLVAMYLVSVNSRSPSCAPSRPMPDCFTPPNGAAGSDTRPRLSPTMPASSASDTRRPRLRSRV